MIPITSTQPPSLVTYIWKHIKRFKLALLIMIMAAIIEAIIYTFNPFLIKKIVNLVDQADRQGPSGKANLLVCLAYPIGWFLFLEFIGEVIWRLYGYTSEMTMIPRLRFNILWHNVNRMLHQSYAFYQQNYAGRLSHSLIKLAYTIPEILDFLHQFLTIMTSFLFGIYILSQSSYLFAALILLWVLFFFLLIYLFNARIVRLSRQLSEKEMEVSGKIVDTLSNILPIKFFVRKRYEKRQAGHTVYTMCHIERHVKRTYLIIFVFLGASYMALQTLSIILLIRAYQGEAVTAGDFALVLMLNNTIITLFWSKVRSFARFSRIVGEGKQALNAVYTPIRILDKPQAKPLKITAGQIEFSHVTFRYQGDQQPIFNNFSLKIPPGQKVGIVGHSGCGKSTLINLLLRLHDIDAGHILIDGQDIAKVTQDSLRKHIGIVPQSSPLFHRSMLDNIRYGNMQALQQELINCARDADAHTFIQQMPQGYATTAGEAGARISGGQRQRIAMARVIAKDAPILLLDEATSQVDGLTEQGMQAALDKLMKHKTTIVIAHRLASLLKMDRILVMHHGTIIEEGTHKQLLAKQGIYTKLWAAQVDGFITPQKEST